MICSVSSDDDERKFSIKFNAFLVDCSVGQLVVLSFFSFFYLFLFSVSPTYMFFPVVSMQILENCVAVQVITCKQVDQQER